MRGDSIYHLNVDQIIPYPPIIYYMKCFQMSPGFLENIWFREHLLGIDEGVCCRQSVRGSICLWLGYCRGAVVSYWGYRDMREVRVVLNITHE